MYIKVCKRKKTPNSSETEICIQYFLYFKYIFMIISTYLIFLMLK